MDVDVCWLEAGHDKTGILSASDYNPYWPVAGVAVTSLQVVSNARVPGFQKEWEDAKKVERSEA